MPIDVPPVTTPSAKPVYAIVTAVIILIIYVGLTWLLFSKFVFSGTDPRPGEWDRALILYNSFVAIASAAAGVVLGAQVQQTNVTNARKDAAEAQKEKTQVKQAAKIALLSVNNALSAMHSSDDQGGGVAHSFSTLEAARNHLENVLD